MTEEQKHWEISVKISSKDCPYSELSPPDITDGKINNFDETRCTHPRCSGMICCISRKELCPLRYETDYPMNPARQVNKDDV